MKKRIIALLMIAVLLLSMVGCGENSGGEKGNGRKTANNGTGKTQELTGGTASETPDVTMPSDSFNKGYANFALKLLAACYQNDNILISPYSVYAALCLVEGGASGDTLKEMETLLGCSREDSANAIAYLMRYGEAKSVVRTANSIWVNSNVKMTVEQNFLKKAGNYFRASVFSAPFSDQYTLSDINDWVKENTKGRIPKILDQLTDEQIMVLINAMTFDGTWKDPFEEEFNEKDADFYCKDGSTKKVELMKGGAERYFEDNKMTGFDRKYENGYTFRAILPKDGVSLEEIVNSFNFFSVPYKRASSISVAMPKFDNESTVQMEDILAQLGMGLAFSDYANFSEITKDINLKVNSVIHKTYISVDETGTKAAAATAITMDVACALEEPLQHYEVRLDHPFVYMIMDDANNVPLFVGIYQ